MPNRLSKPERVRGAGGGACTDAAGLWYRRPSPAVSGA
ncbi:MAG: hypothetical protein K0S46_2666 [Moraxellaceae bacterium]|jgi:hypothetical protein|nr:hypothetical protein [Moraxellaceae bacterium]